MQNETTEARQAVAATGNETDRQQLQQLYIRNYSDILEIIQADRRLTFKDHSDILTDFTRYLAEFDGPPDDATFLTWAADVLRLPKAFYGMKREHEKSVLAGVWSVLKRCSDLGSSKDLKRTAQELAGEVWFWVFLHLEELLTPGTAALSTRLYSRSRFTARAWRTAKLRHAERFEDRDVECYAEDQSSPLDKIRYWEPEYESGSESAYERSETM